MQAAQFCKQVGKSIGSKQNRTFDCFEVNDIDLWIYLRTLSQSQHSWKCHKYVYLYSSGIFETIDENYKQLGAVHERRPH